MADMVWFIELITFCQGCTVMLGGFIRTKLNSSRLTAFLGCAISTAGVLSTYFVIKSGSLYGTYATYGLVFGCGVGITYGIPLQCGLAWFQGHEGIASALIVAGFGGASVIFDQVQTHYINPDNLKPDVVEGESRYFSQAALLNRVPNIFLIMALTFVVLQILGIMLLADNPDFIEHNMLLKPSSPESTPLITRAQFHLSDTEPSQVLRSSTFYVLFLTCFLLQIIIDFSDGYYKAFGQTFISNDQYLAIIGSCGNAGNIIGRLLFGYLADRTSYQTAMCILCTLLTVGFVTMPICPQLGAGPFLVWVMVLFIGGAGTAPLYPFAVAKAFGRGFLASNYGLVFISICFSAISTLLAVEGLLELIGFSGMFYCMAALSFVTFILTAVIHRTDKGKLI